MIVIGIAWFLLLVPSVFLGRLILSLLGMARPAAYWDSAYIGLILLAAGGLFLPLPWMALALGWALVAYQIARKKTGRMARPSCPIAAMATIAALVSIVAVGLVSSRDSITYHYDLIHALSQNGITPGLAWIHNRFGHLSSWFALPAMLEPSSVTAGRTATAANTLLMLVAMCHLCEALYRIGHNRADMADRFWVLASLVCLPLCTFLNLPVSPTPDYAVILYSIVIFYFWLKDDPCGAHSQCAMLMAGALFTVKLSALPLLVVAVVIAWRRTRNRRAWFIVASCSALLVGAWMVASLVNSGYPLFPKTFMSPDVAWRIPEALADQEARTIHGFAFWGQLAKPDAMQGIPVYSWRWLRYWLTRNPMNGIGLGLVLIGATLIPLFAAISEMRRKLWPILFAWGAGMGFVMLTAPATRFALGILISLPAAVLAWFWHRRSIRVLPSRPYLLAFLIVAVCIAPTWLWQTKSEKRITRAHREGVIRLDPLLPRVWRPPLIPHLHYDEVHNIAWLPQPERSHNRPDASEWKRQTWYRFDRCPEGAMFRSANDWRSGIVRAR